MQEDRELDRYKKWSYKYLGTIDAANLQYIFIDLEAANPRHLPEGTLDSIIKAHADSLKLRVYYSFEAKDFILEPANS
jgi:hypothetical protein